MDVYLQVGFCFVESILPSLLKSHCHEVGTTAERSMNWKLRRTGRPLMMKHFLIQSGSLRIFMGMGRQKPGPPSAPICRNRRDRSGSTLEFFHHPQPTLSGRDREILKKLAPEYGDPLCPGSGHEFLSLLPQVSNHLAADEKDFARRLRNISRHDLEYLVRLILDGSESIVCISPENIVELAGYVADTLSLEEAERILELYMNSDPC